MSRSVIKYLNEEGVVAPHESKKFGFKQFPYFGKIFKGKEYYDRRGDKRIETNQGIDIYDPRENQFDRIKQNIKRFI
jgi:hypothetical protein